MKLSTRVLVYTLSRFPADADDTLLQTLRILSEQYHVTLACPDQRTEALNEALRHQRIQVETIAALTAPRSFNPVPLLKVAFSALAAIAKLRRVINRNAPSLIHAEDLFAGLIATLASTGTRTQVLWRIQQDLPHHPLSPMLRGFAHRSTRSTFAAVSSATAKAFSGSLDFGKRMQVLYSGVDPARFPRRTLPPDREAESMRIRFGLEPSDFLAVSCGRLTLRKGLLQLLDSFADVQTELRRIRRLPAHLVVAGAPCSEQDRLHEQALHARAAELGLTGTVHFVSVCQDDPALLRAADLFLLNSLTEPFCEELLQAIASGTPILASNVGGIIEVLEDNVTGQLVLPPYERRQTPGYAMADRLLESITDPHALSAMADRAYEQVLPRFTLDAFARSLLQLYSTLNLKPGED